MKTFIKNQSAEEQTASKAKSFITEAYNLYETKWSKEYKSLGKLFENPAKAYKAAQTMKSCGFSQKCELKNRVNCWKPFTSQGNQHPLLKEILSRRFRDSVLNLNLEVSA